MEILKVCGHDEIAKDFEIKYRGHKINSVVSIELMPFELIDDLIGEK